MSNDRTIDVRFDLLSDSFEVMRERKEVQQEDFIGEGFAAHEEIVNWCMDQIDSKVAELETVKEIWRIAALQMEKERDEWREQCEKFFSSDAIVSVGDALMGHYPKQDALAKLNYMQRVYEKFKENK